MSRARDLAAFVSNADGDIKFDTDTLFIDSSENRVGIGTSLPRSELDIDGGSETQIRLQTANTGSTTSDGLLISLDSAANASGYFWNYENAPTIFGTNNSERMRILAGGGLTFNGDTAAANALDDYEEGTWTPTTPHVTLISNTTARYIKIGKLAIFTLDVNFPSSTSGTASQINNLPFSVATYNSGFNGWNNSGVVVVYHCAGTNAYPYNGTTNASLTYSNLSGKRLIGTIIGIIA